MIKMNKDIDLYEKLYKACLKAAQEMGSYTLKKMSCFGWRKNGKTDS